MRNNLKTLSAAIALALLGGCAGGGGSREDDPNKFLEALFCAPLGLPLNCGELAQAQKASATTSAATPSQASTVSPPPPVAFTTWSDQATLKSIVRAAGPQSVTKYELQYPNPSRIDTISEPTFDSAAGISIQYADNRSSFESADVKLPFGPRGALTGHPEIEVLSGPGSVGYQAVFADMAVSKIGLVANPFKSGWEYQSFGVWNDTHIGALSTIGANSYGAATSGPAVPTTGSAIFTGTLGGLYVSPTGQGSMAAADLTVNANFNARSLNFSSIGTTTARDLTTSTAAPHLNLSGTLTYSPGSNSFTGTLTNASGTMSGTSRGQFYGPAAQELGGVFAIKAPSTVETFTGAYGAKR